MSNPGVILLAAHNKRGGCFEKMKIEDNLGESMHIHLDDYRIDLTIKEYQSFSELIWQALVELDDLPNELKDSNFLSDTYRAVSYAKPIVNLKKTKLQSLSFIKRYRWLRFFYLYRLVKIHQTPQYLYLTGGSNGFEAYPQQNNLGITNIDRLKKRSIQLTESSIKDSISVAVVFGDQSLVVRDGMHMCSILAHKHGLTSEVNVLSVKNVVYRAKFNQPVIWSFKSVVRSTYVIARRLALVSLRKILRHL